MTEIVVTDAHALIWYAQGKRKRLGSLARRVFEAADRGRCVVHVPTLVLVEVLEAARRGEVTLAGGSESWTERLFSTSVFFPVDLTTDIVLHAETLYAIPERTDRLIAATAAVLDHPLITRDPEIARVAGVRWMW